MPEASLSRIFFFLSLLSLSGLWVFLYFKPLGVKPFGLFSPLGRAEEEKAGRGDKAFGHREGAPYAGGTRGIGEKEDGGEDDREAAQERKDMRGAGGVG